MSSSIPLGISFALITFFVMFALSAWIALRPLYAAWLIFGLVLLDTMLLEPIAFQLGLLIYPDDMFFLILSISCFIRFTLIVSPKSVPRAWWLIGAVQFALFIWGLTTYGKSAGVDYRTHYYVWVAVAYFSSIKWTEILIRRVANALIIFSVAVCLLIYYRWITAYFDPIFAKKMLDLAQGGVVRMIGAGPTLMIAIAILVLLFKASTGNISPIQWSLMPIFFLTVVVLQHRSVWVSLLVGVVFLLWSLQQRRHKGKTIIGVLLLIVSLAFFLAVPDKNNGVLESVKHSADKALSTEEGTMVARVGGWQELLSKWAASKNLVTYLVGKPYGSGYTRSGSEGGKITVEFSPHNHYVHTLYRGGLISLAATLYIFYQLGIAGVKLRKETEKRWTPYLLAVLACLLLFYIPYWASFGHGLFIGMAISYFEIARHQQLYRPLNMLTRESLKIGIP